MITGSQLPDGVGNSGLLVLGVGRGGAEADHCQEADGDEEHLGKPVVFLRRGGEVVYEALGFQGTILKGLVWTGRRCWTAKAHKLRHFCTWSNLELSLSWVHSPSGLLNHSCTTEFTVATRIRL